MFWDKVDKTGDCWVWKGCTLKRPNHTDSYGQIRVNGKRIYTHRYAWELTFGPIPVGSEVCHSCDNPLCVRPEHLFLGSHTENMLDAKSKHRMWTPSGEQHYAAKLTWNQVREIRESVIPNEILASISNVSPAAIWFVKSGRHWKGVTA